MITWQKFKLKLKKCCNEKRYKAIELHINAQKKLDKNLKTIESNKDFDTAITDPNFKNYTLNVVDSRHDFKYRKHNEFYIVLTKMLFIILMNFVILITFVPFMQTYQLEKPKAKFLKTLSSSSTIFFSTFELQRY